MLSRALSPPFPVPRKFPSTSARSTPQSLPSCFVKRKKLHGDLQKRIAFSSSGSISGGSIREVTGDAPKLPSGPLHDAAEMVPHMPVVMMFVYSSNGLSHCKEEDTPPEHLDRAIRAFLL